MSVASLDSETESVSHLDYYFSPTSEHVENEEKTCLSPQEKLRREEERRVSIQERLALHRKQFSTFVRAKPVA